MLQAFTFHILIGTKTRTFRCLGLDASQPHAPNFKPLTLNPKPSIAASRGYSSEYALKNQRPRVGFLRSSEDRLLQCFGGLWFTVSGFGFRG